jgi:hypothetical protein
LRGRFHPFAKPSRNDGVGGAPNGICVPRWSLSSTHRKGAVHGEVSRNFSTVTRVGLDLAKRVFQVHAVGAKGEIVVARKLTRSQLIPFFAELAPCVVAMEACSSAHHWGRALIVLGHEVRLLRPAHVKPYVRGLSGILCVRPISSLSDEPFAEDDGELGLGLEPLTRRALPLLGRVVENEI